MRAIALTLCISLCACFPTDAKARFYAKIGEGVSLVGGVLLLAVINTSADCQPNAATMPGLEVDQSTCRKHADAFNELGVTMILAGLLGFVATVSTSPDDQQPAPVIQPGLTPAGTAPTTPRTTPAAPN